MNLERYRDGHRRCRQQYRQPSGSAGGVVKLPRGEQREDRGEGKDGEEVARPPDDSGPIRAQHQRHGHRIDDDDPGEQPGRVTARAKPPPTHEKERQQRDEQQQTLRPDGVHDRIPVAADRNQGDD